MTPVACNRHLGRRCPPRFRVLTHVVEILEVVETGHQPISAKNDPSKQESDVHLSSFLSALLDDPAPIARNPLMLAQKQQDCGSQNCMPGRPTRPSSSISNPTLLAQRFAVRWVDEPNHRWRLAPIALKMRPRRSVLLLPHPTQSFSKGIKEPFGIVAVFVVLGGDHCQPLWFLCQRKKFMRGFWRDPLS